MKFKITLFSILLGIYSYADTIMPPEPFNENGSRSTTPPGQQLPLDSNLIVLFLVMILVSFYFIYKKKRVI